MTNYQSLSEPTEPLQCSGAMCKPQKEGKFQTSNFSRGESENEGR